MGLTPTEEVYVLREENERYREALEAAREAMIRVLYELFRRGRIAPGTRHFIGDVLTKIDAVLGKEVEA